jgi:cytidylate kinase
MTFLGRHFRRTAEESYPTRSAEAAMMFPDSSNASGPEVPLHGFQGNRGVVPERSFPLGVSVAISRESGARGGSIGRHVGRKLGWQVYDQELLEFMAQDAVARQGLLDQITGPAHDWVEARIEELLRQQNLSQHPSVIQLARIILSLGVQGEVVLIGRGAGCILPRESTLQVRIIAPLAERIAYMSQWMRLTVEEASERVRLRDERRAEFLVTHFHRQPGDIHQYDLLLNSVLLGEDFCAELIAFGSRTRAAAFGKSAGPALTSEG